MRWLWLCAFASATWGFVVPQPKPLKTVPLKAQKEDVWTYLFGKPGELDADLRLLGTSRRRIFQFLSLGLGVALAGDFLGMTSNLLSTFPEQARSLRLDTYYRVAGLRRFVDDEYRLEFLFPETWLADREIYVQRQSSPSEAFLQRRKPYAAVAAFRKGKENVSVIRSDVVKGFSLRGTLGKPADAAQRLLDTAIAPPESGKTSKLIDAVELASGYYQFEFTVTLPSGEIFHNLAVVAERNGDQLFTLTILCPEPLWQEREPLFRQVATSFRLEG